jgi:hypothetical protein
MQRRRLLPFVATLSVLAPLFAAGEAHAQGWLADRKYAEGAGIRVGDLELHPGVGAEVGFDSNWFRRSQVEGANIVNASPNAPIRPAGIFRITPSLYIATLGPQRKEGDQNAEPPKVNFRAGMSATYRAFVGPEVVDQNGIGGLSADIDARVDVLPQRPFSFGVGARYFRSVAPNTSGNPDASFNRNLLGLNADVTLTPGGGTLDWRLGYGLAATLLDTPSLSPFNNISHNIFTRGSWKFRPKTAMIMDASFGFQSWTQQNSAVNGLLNSTPLHARVGMSGLITPRFALTAMVGYGGSFVDTTPSAEVQQYNSVVGQLEAKFFLTANPGAEQSTSLAISSIALGYNRDFATSFLGSFYGTDRGYVKFQYFFGGRALVGVEGGAGALQYPNVFQNNGGTFQKISDPFTNVAIDAGVFGEYRFTNTLGLNLTLKYYQEISSKQLPAGGTGLYDMNYRRFEGYLGFRWFL